MGSPPGNVFPVFDKILQRSDKETLLKQRGKVLWLTGLPSSGKTTIAVALERELNKLGYLTQVLDGDNVRAGINSDLGFSDADRKENIRRVSEVSKLFAGCGIITISCFISPTEEIRNIARNIIGDDLVEIFIDAPLEVCEQRDVKGLYAKARKGELKSFTGIDAPFERPVNAVIEIDTVQMDVDAGVKKIFHFIEPLVSIK